MTYQKTLAHIYGLGRFGMKPGLAKIHSLLASLGNPHENVQVVHVAGTNGKGSTACFLAEILASTGNRIGLFTSPHLVSFTERFRINGSQISEEEVVTLAEQVLSAAPPEATFFEIITAMAYLWFAEQRVDLAVMEAGMGGKLDATNTANGIMSVITPVSLDHCDYLGATIAEIAGEKAGIIKARSPVVLSSQCPEARKVIEAEAERLASPLFCFGRDFSSRWGEKGLDYDGLRTRLTGIRPGTGGCYQAMNAATALAAAELLGTMGFLVEEGALRRGIEQAAWPGRMERVSDVPRLYLDCAHNPAGAEALAESLAELSRSRLILLIGLMADKDVSGILDSLLPQVDEVIAVTPSLDRALSSKELTGICHARGVPCLDAGTVAAGLAAAWQSASGDDIIVACGSIFTVGEVKGALGGEAFEPFRG